MITFTLSSPDSGTSFDAAGIMTETLQLRGTLMGHNGWVTQIATNPKYPDMILSASRDKTLIVWKLTRDEMSYGIPQKRLHGHGHFVSDVVLSSDGHFALSGSWDKTLRLWDLSAGEEGGPTWMYKIFKCGKKPSVYASLAERSSLFLHKFCLQIL